MLAPIKCGFQFVRLMPVNQWHNYNRFTLSFSLNTTQHAKMGASTPSYQRTEIRRRGGMISFLFIRFYSRFETFKPCRPVDAVAFGLPLSNFLLFSCFSFLSWFFTRTSIYSNKKFERRIDILVCLEYGMLKRVRRRMSVLRYELEVCTPF